MSILFKTLLGMNTAMTAVGTPIVKGAKFASKKALGSTKNKRKFIKAKKYISKESKEMKNFFKQYPELSAGAVTIGGATGYGIGKAIESRQNKKKG